MTKPVFNCSQSELYTIATLGWNSCSQHLAQFTGFKPKYNAAFITDQLSAVQYAKDLPSEAERNYDANIHHIQLTDAAKSCRDLYQRLKRYIIEAYPESQQQASLNSAGQQYFVPASANNWDAVESLMSAAVNFTSAHTAQLTNNDNMPPGFPAILTSAATGFSTLHQTFLDDEEASKIATSDKLRNNNQVYEALISMFLDGQEIFKNQEAILSQFIFEHCLLLVRGAGTAGVRGTVTDSVTTLPIEGATITVGVNDYTGTTNTNGQYEISPAAAGTYTVTVTAPGYQPLTIPSHQILTGTISTLNLLLIPEP
jgi:hypothetical protein